MMSENHNAISEKDLLDANQTPPTWMNEETQDVMQETVETVYVEVVQTWTETVPISTTIETEVTETTYETIYEYAAPDFPEDNQLNAGFYDAWQTTICTVILWSAFFIGGIISGVNILRGI